MRKPFDALASVSLGAALVAAILGVVEPFTNAAWLVAYLFLVGFLAQVLLGRGQDVLVRGRHPVPTSIQAALWNGGVVAVPAGVFLDARLLVVIGAIALLSALVSFWRETKPIGSPGERPAGLSAAYAVLIVVMAASTFIGVALAWERPWL